MPFAGDEHDARATAAALERIALEEGDELVLVDNSAEGTAARVAGPGVRIVRAGWIGSSYYARNVGARATSAPWLLFCDSDCTPAPDLVDRYFDDPVPDAWGAIAGGVRPAGDQRRLVARYARSRGHLDQRRYAEHPYRPLAVTANVLVRRTAFDDVGGFHEVRSGGDADLSWRLQAAGWELGARHAAIVEHHDRETVRAMGRQMARYAAGGAWLERRHPGSAPPARTARELARSAAGIPWWLLRGAPERAAFKALDGVAVTAQLAGRWASNAPRALTVGQPGLQGTDVAVVAELFPELSQTFVATEARALQRAGHRVRVIAAARGHLPEASFAHGIPTRYFEDDGHAACLAALGRLVAAHPVACARDLMSRRRWRREEQVTPLRRLAPAARALARDRPDVLHAHFAGGPALDAMRLSRLLGIRFSFTAHAYDIFREPANLREKLLAAQVATSGCDYNVDHLRRLAGGGANLHRIVMGVDPATFRRTSPYPGGRSVLAVGRLVEKKGFTDLIEAAAVLRRRGSIDRVRIVGDGPLRGALERRIAELGLQDVVELAGARRPDEVRAALEAADVLAMPCVVAADGDRDSMPVVVKEALAMEVPVVATDEVGLPEVVHREWGRLVPPADPPALAAALEEVLALPVQQRAAMGREGRAFVVRACDADAEARRLAALWAGDPESTGELPGHPLVRSGQL